MILDVAGITSLWRRGLITLPWSALELLKQHVASFWGKAVSRVVVKVISFGLLLGSLSGGFALLPASQV